MTEDNGFRSAPIPLRAPAARPVAYLVALVLAAIGVMAGHDWLARMGAIERPELIAGFVDWLDAHGWDNVLLPASVLATLVGLVLLYVAVRPRRRTHVRASGRADQWLRPVDVGRLAARAARRCPGVFDATAIATERAVSVTIDAGGAADDDALMDKVRAAVDGELAAALGEVPTVKIRATRKTPEGGKKR
ncbi:DUF6286 domain-containing protein [Corynebacterium hansenii]|uniref:DUF6286 domain-containing protein n=1 Tax=Corynebacterium hansenii TaxID=394964 RepID=A0ABV7ZN45_9CORY|nr:DUF6286 domain-containing protein [Corynebacterium hansenii]WJY98991.1 hypothetical protein CHAN_01800 [Corynebacterium hansenii]